MTAILGISAFYHDSAAALIVDGHIVAAAQEERFSRIKHDAGFPSQAIRFCLEHAGLDWQQLDYVGFYEKPLLKLERVLETYLLESPRGCGSFLDVMPRWLGSRFWQSREIRRGIHPRFRKPIVYPRSP